MVAGMRLLMVLSVVALGLPGCGDDDPASAIATDVPPADVQPPDVATPDAGSDDMAEEVKAPIGCEGTTVFMWSPTANTQPRVFPDAWYEDDDANTVTGRALRFDLETAPWVSTVPPAFQLVFEQLNLLDGFGTTAGIFLGFSGPLGELPTGEEASTTDPRLQLIELSDPPVRRPFELRRTDDDTTLVLMPMVPLKPATEHLVVMTTEAEDTSGGCVDAGPALRLALDGAATDARSQVLGVRLSAALEQADVARSEVSAALTFTTQSIGEESAAIAAHIRAEGAQWTGDASCTDAALFIDCERTFGVNDYRVAEGVQATPTASYDMPVRMWLPPQEEGGGPYPTMVFGHGLSGDRHQAQILAEAVAGMGVIVVAVDAVEHGTHPAGTSGSSLEAVMAFFGISISDLSLTPTRLRDNWRQSTYDKLQVVQLLRTSPDLDGDGTDDVDTEHLIYFGVSLGAIMGPELLAHTDAFGVAILAVGGGRVSTIIEEASQFSLVIDIMKPPGTSDGDVARFFPILQTLIERGDSANYARAVTERPAELGAAPHLLVMNVLDDDTVPPGTNRMLARALGIPHIPPVLDPVGIIPVLDGAPVSGNAVEGTQTRGLFQYDTITESESGNPKTATHSNVAKSREAILQAVTFIETWLDTGVPTIIDPYAALAE
ncbi:MAG: hypothetical protein ACI9WU_000268 [Myxococcota bacterium]|jgi:hypothetical protein